MNTNITLLKFAAEDPIIQGIEICSLETGSGAVVPLTMVKPILTSHPLVFADADSVAAVIEEDIIKTIDP